ncbi:MAG: thioredoxin family protein [Thermoguttaceae bacterium]|nr:thioredoxin family protein [Thermoguttaceae bacterium]
MAEKIWLRLGIKLGIIFLGLLLLVLFLPIGLSGCKKNQQTSPEITTPSDSSEAATSELDTSLLTPLNNEEEFNKFLEEHKIVVVEFGATWCKYCHQLVPDLVRLAKEYENQEVVFAQVDTDQCPALSQKYWVEGLPDVIIFVNGKSQGRVLGYNPVELQKVLSNIVEQAEKPETTITEAGFRDLLRQDSAVYSSDDVPPLEEELWSE